MTPDPKLHHAAHRIAPKSLETLLEMFELLGVRQQYRQGKARWALVGQDWLKFSIQLIETQSEPLVGPTRLNAQISFISENPTIHVSKIERWAQEQGIRFTKGSWSEKEHWFDLPDLFTDSIIEIMHVSILED